MRTQVDGERFSLHLDHDGLPYALKRWNGVRCYQVWAEWHKGLPTGVRKRAIEQMGFKWHSETYPCHWEKVAPK
jgi:hypothetical protein